MPYEERAKLNYDHPDSFDTDILIEDPAPPRGHSIKCPVYDYSIHDRTDRTITVRPESYYSRRHTDIPEQRAVRSDGH